jgi:hypothetical protein
MLTVLDALGRRSPCKVHPIRGRVMPLFNCSKCGVVENTALGEYWYNKAKGKPVLCSECGEGKWHGRFPRSFERLEEPHP